LEKPSVVALTKCDLLAGNSVDASLTGMHARVFPISSVTKEGLAPLLRHLWAELQ
jgi:hypothetical protein